MANRHRHRKPRSHAGAAVAAALALTGAVAVVGLLGVNLTPSSTRPSDPGQTPAAVVATRAPAVPVAPSTAGPPKGPPTPSPSQTATRTPPAGRSVLWRLEDRSDSVRAVEARLAELGRVPVRYVDGYFGTTTRDGVRAFQKAVHLPVTGAVDQRTWTALKARTRRPSRAELLGVVLDPRCRTGRALCIDKTTFRLAWVVDGTIRNAVDVRFGSEYTPTREGVFSVFWKHLDHVSTLYGSAMPYSMFFSGGQAVHYSSDFAARGYAGASHGCVNVRDLTQLRQVYAEVRVGDPVVIYRS